MSVACSLGYRLTSTVLPLLVKSQLAALPYMIAGAASSLAAGCALLTYKRCQCPGKRLLRDVSECV